MREIYRSDHYLVTADLGQKLLRIARTSTPFSDLAQLPRELQSIVAAVDGAGIDKASTRLLMDAREAPLRNDPAFEEASRENTRVAAQFAKFAVLIKTATGRLQFNRLQRERKTEVQVFDDEANALRYLLSD